MAPGFTLCDRLDEKRERFEAHLFELGVKVYDLPQYQIYRQERAVVNKALLVSKHGPIYRCMVANVLGQTIRRAQTPPGEPLPGSLKRENAVTRSAFLNGDTRPREECFDSDEETAVGDEFY